MVLVRLVVDGDRAKTIVLETEIARLCCFLDYPRVEGEHSCRID
jgi:hypothetical protein